jgi:hypothetical protein
VGCDESRRSASPARLRYTAEEGVAFRVGVRGGFMILMFFPLARLFLTAEVFMNASFLKGCERGGVADITAPKLLRFCRRIARRRRHDRCTTSHSLFPAVAASPTTTGGLSVCTCTWLLFLGDTTLPLECCLGQRFFPYRPHGGIEPTSAATGLHRFSDFRTERNGGKAARAFTSLACAKCL